MIPIFKHIPWKINYFVQKNLKKKTEYIDAICHEFKL